MSKFFQQLSDPKQAATEAIIDAIAKIDLKKIFDDNKDNIKLITQEYKDQLVKQIEKSVFETTNQLTEDVASNMTTIPAIYFYRDLIAGAVNIIASDSPIVLGVEITRFLSSFFVMIGASISATHLKHTVAKVLDKFGYIYMTKPDGYWSVSNQPLLDHHKDNWEDLKKRNERLQKKADELVNKINQNKEVSAEAEGDDEPIVGILTLIYQAILASIGLRESKPKGLSEMTASFAKSMANTAGRTRGFLLFFSNLVRYIKAVYLCIRNWLLGYTIRHEIVTDSPELLKLWLDECCLLLSPLNEDKIMGDVRWLARLKMCLTVGEGLISDVTANDCKKFKSVNVLLNYIQKLKELNTKAYYFSTDKSIRKEPFCLWNYGEPGVGKTSMFNQLVADLQKEQLLDTVLGNPVFTVQPGVKHWTGCKGKNVCYMDDFLTVGDPQRTAEEVATFMQLKSSSEFRPEQAAVEDKGIPFAPELVVVNSNLLDLSHVSEIKNHKAFHRRRNLIIETRLHYARFKAKTIDPGNLECIEKLKACKEKYPDEKFPYMLFDVFDGFEPNYAGAPKLAEDISYEELLKDFICPRLREFRKNATEDYNRKVEAFVSNVTSPSPDLPLKDYIERTTKLVPSKFKQGWTSQISSKFSYCFQKVAKMYGKNVIEHKEEISDIKEIVESVGGTVDDPKPKGEADEDDEEDLFEQEGDFTIQTKYVPEHSSFKETVGCAHTWDLFGNILTTVSLDYVRQSFVFKSNDTKFEVLFACSSKCNLNQEHWLKKLQEISPSRAELVMKYIHMYFSHDQDIPHRYSIPETKDQETITQQTVEDAECQVPSDIWKDEKYRLNPGKWLDYDSLVNWLKEKKQTAKDNLAKFRTTKEQAKSRFIAFWDKHKRWIYVLGGLGGLIGAGLIGYNLYSKFKGKKTNEKDEYQIVQLVDSQMIPSGDSIQLKHQPRVMGITRKIAAESISSTYLIDLIKNNTCYLQIEGNHRNSGIRCSTLVRCLGLYGHNVLMLKHYHTKIRLMDNLTVKYASMSGTVCLNLIWDHCKVTNFKDSELVIVRLPSHVGQFRDIRKHFVNEGTVNSVGLPSVGCMVEAKLADSVNTYSLNLRVEKQVGLRYEDGSDIVLPTVISYGWQKPGRCMSVLIANFERPLIIAVHVGGDSGYGCAEPVVRETFSEEIALEPAELEGKFLSAEAPRVVLDTHVTAVGVVEKKYSAAPARKSQIVESVVHGVFPIRTCPNPLTKIDVDNKFSPLLEGIKFHGEPCTGFDPDEVELCAQDYLEMLLTQAKPVNLPVRRRTYQEVVCGIPGQDGFESMELGTSEGFPYTAFRPRGCSSKRWLITVGHDDEMNYRLQSIHPSVLEIMKEKEEMRKRGIIPPTVFVDCLKDTRIPVEKYFTPGKTRIFSVSPTDFTIQFRQFYIDIIAALKVHRFSVEHSVGINVHSYEWTKLARLLVSKGDKILCGDYSKYGPRLDNGVALAVFRAWIEWSRRHGMNESDCLQMECMAYEICQSVHLCMNVLYRVHCGAPSGCPPTTLLNSGVNSLYIRLAWRECWKDNAMMRSFVSFRKHVVLFSYGDDVIINVSDIAVTRFNNLYLQDFFAKHDIKYTDAAKSGEIRIHCTLLEADFLKNKFVPHPDRPGVFTAGLEKRSIEDCANWIVNSVDRVGASLETSYQALMLAYGWGRSYFNFVRTKLIEAWRNRAVEQPNFYTYDDLDVMRFPDPEPFDNLENFCKRQALALAKAKLFNETLTGDSVVNFSSSANPLDIDGAITL